MELTGRARAHTTPTSPSYRMRLELGIVRLTPYSSFFG